MPYFTPDTQLRSNKNEKGIVVLKSEPLTVPRAYAPDQDHFGHDEDERRQQKLNKNPNQ